MEGSQVTVGAKAQQTVCGGRSRANATPTERVPVARSSAGMDLPVSIAATLQSPRE